MPRKKSEDRELLEYLVIIELIKAGVPQLEIQKILNIDIHRISRIAKYFNKSNKK